MLRGAYRLRVATDGQGALELAAAVSPDLILLDIMMPGLDGFAACRRLKAEQDLRDVPAIFVSALAETRQKVRALAEGGADYVTKPFQPEEVEARVATHLRLRRLQRELEEHNAHLEGLVRERTRDLLKANEEVTCWPGPDDLPDFTTRSAGDTEASVVAQELY
jgi:DNA-binding response OmpR family regulator